MSNQRKINLLWVYLPCAVLLLALVVTQFLPFWTVEEDSASISGMLWLANSHRGVSGFIVGELGSAVMLANFAWAPALVLVLGVLGILLCALRFKAIIVAIVTLLVGLIGINQYLGMPVFQTGANWMLHLVVSILVVVAAIASIVYIILASVRMKKAMLAEAE